MKKKKSKKRVVRKHKKEKVKNKYEINSKNIKLISAIFETILAVPFLGGFFVLMTAWMLLAVGLVLGIVGVIICSKEKTNKSGHILQIITSCIGWIPVIGWLMHLITAVVLWQTWSKE